MFLETDVIITQPGNVNGAAGSSNVRKARTGRLGIERFDGESVIGSQIEPLLIEAGFRQGPRRLILSA